ncbi:MAG: acyl-CoA dehydrogenase, partial [Gammaproteobacteria bacterium]|nr:acyl-CoA dehydrogenase [Gammaproteobacteria bacterium]
MNSANNQNFPEIRAAVRRLCEGFPGTYWQALDRDRVYPTEFVEALSAA